VKGNFKWNSDSPCKDGNARFTMVPLKAFPDQAWLDMNIYNFENCLFLIVVSLQSDLHISTAGKHIGVIRIDQFQSSRNDNIVHIIDQKNVSRVQLWIRHCHLMNVRSLEISLTVPLITHCTFIVQYIYKKILLNTLKDWFDWKSVISNSVLSILKNL